MKKEITRLGVYGVLLQDNKILLVYQKQGLYAGKLDFPGGGMEFGESPEEALRREFAEEVAMEFDSLLLLNNLTAKVDVPAIFPNDAYLFFHIGMIYKINGFRLIEEQSLRELQSIWIDPKTLTEDQCSSLLWKYKQKYIDG